MKTTNLFRLMILFVAIMGFTFTGCKKDKTENPVDSSSLTQLSKDEEAVENASDESLADVNVVLSQGSLKSTETLPCNATVDSTAVANDTITIYITYNGLNCSGTRFRTGQVVIMKQVGQHWYEQGATVIVKHINFTITKVSTQKTITMNGVKVYKNVSGGVIWQLGNQYTAIVHRVLGHVSVTFDDGTTRTWNVARQKTFTGTAPNNLVLTTDGFGSAGDFNNLVIWGVNRQGENFYTQIVQPVVIRQACDWDPVSGVKKHAIPADNKSATITFGYDSNNQPISGTDCPTKYKVDWQKNNQSGTVYLWL